ncbi:virulence factor [Sphingomonas sp. SUN019]|uniref:virulence factor n=1 Tax=Sphingomonas sp. SUN019 TaxID=2937788 RepID=UPI0021645F2A|nr:virulence factor [Sphingomonas sp. SUN019]UVO50704.1 virulence factor [Sphingomonas sp. SUN019]
MIAKPIARLRRVLGIAALLAGLAGLVVALAVLVPALHLIDRPAIRMFGTSKAHPDVVAVYASGDTGLRFGKSPKVISALAARGIPVAGIDSAVNFASHRSRAQVDAIVANAIRLALARTGASRVVLMGQSFGADIVATAALDLPTVLRPKVAAINLVVPSRTVFFRADPTEITYRGTPDATPAAALRRLDWTPVSCIYGAAETDSLCPLLRGTRAQVVPLPGGHFLRRDHKLIIATIIQALRHADPTIID